MSYILDALKRSEQERARGETPDVTTRHDYAPSGSGTGSGRSRTVAWLVAGALSANALLFAFWLFSGRPAGAPGPETAPSPIAGRGASEAPATPRVAAPRVAAQSAGEAPASAPVAPAAREVMPSGAAARRPQPAPASTAVPEAPGSAAVDAPTTAPIADTGAPAGRSDEAAAGDDAGYEAAPKPSAPEPVSIRDLPDRIQRRIPTLEFATHIFGDAPRYREVTINGRRYAEGERVEGMLLSEITETGVVFDFEGYRFEMSVLDDWDY